MGTSEHAATSGAACRAPVRSSGRTAGRRSFCQGSGRVPTALGPTGPSAHHHQVAGGGCGRLPFADGGQVAPRPVPQGWPGRSGGRRMRPPPSVLLSLLLQNPAHNLVPSELLLLLEGAAGRCRGLGRGRPRTRAGSTALPGIAGRCMVPRRLPSQTPGPEPRAPSSPLGSGPCSWLPGWQHRGTRQGSLRLYTHPSVHSLQQLPAGPSCVPGLHQTKGLRAGQSCPGSPHQVG